MGHAEPHGSCRTVQGVALPCWDAYKQGHKRGCTAEDILAMGFSMAKFQRSLPPARHHAVVVWLHGQHEEIQRIE